MCGLWWHGNHAVRVMQSECYGEKEINMTKDLQAKLEGIAISKANAYRPHHPEKQRKSRRRYGKKQGNLPKQAGGLKFAPRDAPIIPEFMREILERHTSTPF